MATERGAQLFVTVWAAARRSVRLVEQRLREEGADDHELALVLELVLADGPLTTTAVAERMGVAFMTASDALTRLESRGTVRQAPNPADRRSSLFMLTEQGEVQARRALSILAPLAEELAAAAGLSVEDIQGLAARLNEAFTKEERGVTPRSPSR
ncbi:MAG: MarR family transcriptional regulator [Gaiellaceae bacterium]